MPLSPALRRSLPIVVTMLVGVALGLGARLFAHGQPVVMAVWAISTVAVAGAASVYCWRALDEVAREAHKTAWFWGGSTGMLGAFLALTWAQAYRPDLLARGLGGGTGPGDLVELGLLWVIVAQLIGYLVVWIGWWISKR